MDDMPKTIWVTKDDDDVSAQIEGDLYAQHYREGMTGKPVKYIRADLAVAGMNAAFNAHSKERD